MHLHINVKSPNNISKWQVGFNSAFKGLKNKIELEKCRINSERRAAVGWIYFEYSLLLGKSVWNSYATLHEHTSGASMNEEDKR
jgi:hypothetical protein